MNIQLLITLRCPKNSSVQVLWGLFRPQVCKLNYLSPYGILLVELPLVAVCRQVRNKCQQVIPLPDC